MASLSLRVLLVTAMLITGIFPVVATSLYLRGQVADALTERSEAQLDSIRAGRQRYLENYVEVVQNQNAALAANLATAEAAVAFAQAFEQLPEAFAADGASLSEAQKRVTGFYTGQFAPEYSARNEGASLQARGLAPTDSRAVVAQYLYMANNSYSLGEKDKLDRSPLGSTYDAVHSRFHPWFQDYLNRFGYYDIFLVEPERGAIVYSVFKESDYATSLWTGPYRDSNIARVARAAMALPPGEVATEDFAAYRPSYDAAASFVGSPIYVDGNLAGALVFQMPVDRLNGIMLATEGLGETGEALLVGSDKLFRSQSRFSDNDTILKASLDSDVVSRALAGDSGTALAEIDGKQYLTSYAPLQLSGLSWAVVARIETSEAFAALSALQWTMLVASLIAAALVAVAGFLIAQRLYQRLGGDPAEIEAIARRIAGGDLADDGSDGRRSGAYAALVDMRANLRNVLGTSRQIASEVQTGATELSDGNIGLSERTEQQAANLEETASSTEQLTSTVRQNAENARSARDLAEETQGRATTSGDVAIRAIDAMTDINDASAKISNIIGVIDEIAFQTNLLALNAAVEAARAGEQGRGFAVVATEVRQLAGRSASAAREIKELIEDTVTKVHGGTELVQQSGEELRHIVTSISELTQIVGEISNASDEQAAGIDQINQALIHMDSVTQQNAALVEQAAATSKAMSDQAVTLNSSISYFSFDGSPLSPSPAAEMQPTAVPSYTPPAPSARQATPAAAAPARASAAEPSDDVWEEF